ncbi:hypothetical protein LUZ60_003382 [Juncus effusus]|nr:hypothetical protein LUZ60_003382 [Juncus effusus]
MARSGDTDEIQPEIWGTWEDLLLASAVNRHGTSHWDEVAAEVQSRSPFSHLLTPTSCRNRYNDLHRRFAENGAAAAVGSSDEGGDIDPSDSGAWIEELRKLRVAELRREVERYDLSIVSLELKVNRLKEEHESSVKESDPSGGDAKQEPTVEDRKDDDDRSPGSTAAEISSRSCKESNSTDLKQEDKHKSKQDDESGTGVEEDTGTDRTAGQTTKRDGGESGESVADSKESSDVQSSASLSTRRRKAASSSSEVETEAKSEPLLALMEMIRSDNSASLFQRRQEPQESETYKSMIKRHVDLDSIQSKLDLRNSLESYSSPLEFYRDLLLLCTNALLFFPKSSPEFSSASSLLSLVNSHLSSSNLLKPRVASSSSSSHKEVKLTDILTHKPDPDPKLTNPLLEKPTIIMCRKRSSLSKPNNSSQTGSSSLKEEKQQQTNAGLISDPDPNPKKSGTTRGPRTNKTRTNTTLHALNPNPNSSTSKPQKQQQMTDKNSADKKRTAVDFLNRLNQSAPATSSSRVSMLEKGGKSQSEGKRGNKKSVSPGGKRNVGRPPKRPGSSSVTPPPAKRFKEDGSKAGQSGKRRGARR